MSAILPWAVALGVRASTVADWPTGDFRTDPRLDFGRWQTRTPTCVLHPTTTEQLAGCMAELGRRRVPFVTRAAAHSAGGQVLSDGGVVIDLSGLARVLADDPAAQTLTVQAGAWWLTVVEQLVATGRRPPVLTDNLRSSIGGTLVVGGFGDTTHRAGLQAEHVAALRVVTVDGEVHAVNPGDPLFDYTLCGRGQLAVIAEATLATVTRSHHLHARIVQWDTLAHFARASEPLVSTGGYDYVRARMLWQKGLPVRAIAGTFVGAKQPPPVLASLGAKDIGPLESLDLRAVWSVDPHDQWQFASPALELILPLPSGLETWERLAERLVRAGLHSYMPRGSSIMLVRSAPALPLAPIPTDLALLVALRLELPPYAAPGAVAILRELGLAALAEGARSYLMSVELGGERFLDQQFGAALPTFRALKAQHDPHRLLNPWCL